MQVKRKHNIRNMLSEQIIKKQHPVETKIFSLSSHVFSKDEMKVLNEGLSLCPTQKADDFLWIQINFTNSQHHVKISEKTRGNKIS